MHGQPRLTTSFDGENYEEQGLENAEVTGRLLHSISTVLAPVMLGLLLALTALAACAQPVVPERDSPPEIDSRRGAGLPSTDQLREMIATLEDPAGRRALVEALQVLLAAQEASDRTALERTTTGAQLLAQISRNLGELRGVLSRIASAFSDLPDAFAWLVFQISDRTARDAWVEPLAQIAIALSIAYILQLMARYAISRRHSDSPLASPWSQRLRSFAADKLVDLIPVAVFTVAAYVAVGILDLGALGRLAALTIANAAILVSIVKIVARRVLGVGASQRPIDVTNQTATSAYSWTLRFAYAGILGYLLPQAALALGLPFNSYLALTRVVGLVLSAMAVILIVRNRAVVARWLNPGSADSEPNEERPEQRSAVAAAVKQVRRAIAGTWHILAIAYIAIIYMIWALGIEGGFALLSQATLLSALAVLVARGLLNLGDRLFDRHILLPPGLRTRLPTLQGRVNAYIPMVNLLYRLLVYVAAAIAFLSAWGLDAFGWFLSTSGQALASTALSIVIVLVAALLAWEIVSGLTEAFLSGTSDQGARVDRSNRVGTLVPLVRNASLVVLVTFAAFICLSEIGVDIGPLLAGAGVVGLAVGFGAQTLVKDVITGIFILLEDTISVGDVVDVGDGHSGVVETVSIRSIRLRDLSGWVHTVPFSAVAAVTSLTKNFSYYVFDIGVSYREDTDQVVDVIRQLGDELQKDPAYKDAILNPLEILGLDAFADSAVVIKARFRTRPIQQWAVGREFNRRLKRRFDELGIEIPFPHRTLFIHGQNGAVRKSTDATIAQTDRGKATTAGGRSKMRRAVDA